MTDKFARNLASKVLTPRRPKKEAEEAVMRGFLTRLGFGHFALALRERPDFTVTFESDASPVRISCELTTYCSDPTKFGSIQRRRFAMWTGFAERLRDRLRREGLSHYYGAIFFQSNFYTCVAANEDALSEEIVQALRPLSGSTTLRAFDRIVYPVMARHVDHVLVRDTSPEDGVLWWEAGLQTGRVVQSFEALKSCIKSKGKKAQSFEKLDVREAWLVVHAPGRGLSDLLFLSAEPDMELVRISQVAPNIFDRVFLWDGFGESIHQLYPHYKVILNESRELYVRRLPDFLIPFLRTILRACYVSS